MSKDIVNAVNDLNCAISFGGGGGGGGGGGRDAAYYGGAAAVCVAGTRVSGALWSSPVKTPHTVAAATVASVVTFAGCTLAGDAIPRPSDR